MITIPGKIPILIHPIFWFFAALLGWLLTPSLSGMVLWTAIIFISVLFHEFGHALTARFFGQETQIELLALGGVTKRFGKKISKWKEFLIVLNGPLAGFTLFLTFLWLDSHFALGIFVSYMWKANLLWTILNLIPVHPLDGGQLLRIVLEGVFGFRGLQFSYLLSSFLSLLIGLAFFSIHEYLAGTLFFLFTFESYRAWQASRIMNPLDTDEDLLERLKEAESAIQTGDEERALSLLESLRQSLDRGFLYANATESTARLLIKRGELQKAYDMLKPIDQFVSPEMLRLMHQVAFQLGYVEDTIALGNRSYQSEPHYDIALMNAISHAVKGEATPAVGWLQRAVEDGLPNLRMVLDKPEFDGIRQTAAFQQLVDSTRAP